MANTLEEFLTSRGLIQRAMGDDGQLWWVDPFEAEGDPRAKYDTLKFLWDMANGHDSQGRSVWGAAGPANYILPEGTDPVVAINGRTYFRTGYEVNQFGEHLPYDPTYGYIEEIRSYLHNQQISSQQNAPDFLDSIMGPQLVLAIATMVLAPALAAATVAETTVEHGAIEIADHAAEIANYSIATSPTASLLESAVQNLVSGNFVETPYGVYSGPTYTFQADYFGGDIPLKPTDVDRFIGDAWSDFATRNPGAQWNDFIDELNIVDPAGNTIDLSPYYQGVSDVPLPDIPNLPDVVDIPVNEAYTPVNDLRNASMDDFLSDLQEQTGWSYDEAVEYVNAENDFEVDLELDFDNMSQAEMDAWVKENTGWSDAEIEAYNNVDQIAQNNWTDTLADISKAPIGALKQVASLAQKSGQKTNGATTKTYPDGIAGYALALADVLARYRAQTPGGTQALINAGLLRPNGTMNPISGGYIDANGKYWPPVNSGGLLGGSTTVLLIGLVAILALRK